MPATGGMRVIGRNAAIAPAVERTLGKGEVACSNHAGSTIHSLFINMLRSYLCWLVICIDVELTLFITFKGGA